MANADAQAPQSTPAPSGVRQLQRWLGQVPSKMPPAHVGKNHELVRRAFRDVIAAANKVTAQVYQGDDLVALGTIVHRDGLIVSKSSEVDFDSPTCRIPKHGKHTARVVQRIEQLDLVLLQVNATGLPAVDWNAHAEEPTLGSWVAVPSGFRPDPTVVGIVSASPHGVERDMPVIGVQIEDSPGGVVVREVIEGSGAEEVGIREGDVIQSAGGEAVATAEDLVQAIRGSRPGRKIKIAVRRDDRRLVFQPVLGRQTNLGMADGNLSAHEGGPLSERRSEFANVIQHDCLIRPNQCGGPLVNIEGQIIGINIARAGRAASLALPLSTVDQTLRPVISKVIEAR